MPEGRLADRGGFLPVASHAADAAKLCARFASYGFAAELDGVVPVPFTEEAIARKPYPEVPRI
jgi:hypothetical protein